MPGKVVDCFKTWWNTQQQLPEQGAPAASDADVDTRLEECLHGASLGLTTPEANTVANAARAAVPYIRANGELPSSLRAMLQELGLNDDDLREITGGRMPQISDR